MYLKCTECNGGEFVEWHKLRESQAGGVVKELGGSRCVKCNKPTDIGKALRAADLVRRKAELDLLNEEMKGNEPQKAMAKSEGPPELPRLRGEPSII